MRSGQEHACPLLPNLLSSDPKSATMKMKARAKHRKPIRKVPPARTIDAFFDPTPREVSVELGPPFDVATLNRPRPNLFKSAKGSRVNCYFGDSGADGLFGYDAKTDKLKFESEVEQDLQRLGPLPENHEYVLREEEFHPHHGFSRPQTLSEMRPGALDKRSEDIVTPSERRACLEYLRRVDMANREIRKSKAFKHRRDETIARLYPNGVLGIDSADNLESPVYSQTARQRKEHRRRLALTREQRAQKIAAKTISKNQRGFDLLEHVTDPSQVDEEHKRMEETVWISKKGKGEFPKDPRTTFERLFLQTHQERKPTYGSMRYDIEKRSFDIVTGRASNRHGKPSPFKAAASRPESES